VENKATCTHHCVLDGVSVEAKWCQNSFDGVHVRYKRDKVDKSGGGKNCMQGNGVQGLLCDFDSLVRGAHPKPEFLARYEPIWRRQRVHRRLIVCSFPVPCSCGKYPTTFQTRIPINTLWNHGTPGSRGIHHTNFLGILLPRPAELALSSPHE